MTLPDCYDPVVQEERRQLAWDRWIRRFPVCHGCGQPLLAGAVYFALNVGDKTLNICQLCRQEMEENIHCVEERSW